MSQMLLVPSTVWVFTEIGCREFLACDIPGLTVIQLHRSPAAEGQSISALVLSYALTSSNPRHIAAILPVTLKHREQWRL
jgi:hypothetical protein